MPKLTVRGLGWKRAEDVARRNDAGNVEAAQVVQRQVDVWVLKCIAEKT